MPDASKPPRFYRPRSEGAAPGFVVGCEAALPFGEAHHAAHVLRLRPGAAVELFDGVGGSALGRIVRVHRREVAVTVDEVRPPTDPPEPRVTLAFAVPKGNRLDWLLEKTTELGVARLSPVLFERSIAGWDKLSAAKRARWFGHSIAAAKQAGLDWFPEIADPQHLAAFLEEAASNGETAGGRRLFGDLSARAVPICEALTCTAPPRRVCLVVGPEGGLAEAEREALQRAGFVGVRLGRTTLRIETAAVALLAAALVVAAAGPNGNPAAQQP
jgi:16S rRNA (uracil1498-N3)-methyltransferase